MISDKLRLVIEAAGVKLRADIHGPTRVGSEVANMP